MSASPPDEIPMPNSEPEQQTTEPIIEQLEVTAESGTLAAIEDKIQPHAQTLPLDRRAGCWWAYLLALVIALPGAFLIPSSAAAGLLMIGVAVSLAVAAQDAELRPRDFADFLRKTLDFMRGSPTLFDAQRERIAMTFTLIATVLMVLSAVGFRPSNRNPDLSDAVVLMLLGGGALLIAVIAARPVNDITEPAENPLIPQRSNWPVTALGVVLLLAVAEINAHVLEDFARSVGIDFRWRVSFHIQALLFYSGIAFVVWGLAGAPRVQLRRPELNQYQKIEYALLGAIFLLALAVRAFGLDTTLRVSIDEAVAIPGIFHMWNQTDVGLVAPPSAYQTTLVFSHWQSILVAIFGQTLTGLRITSAFTGALTVLALYMLARALFDRPTALLAALLLATFPPHMHFSRIGLLHIADPLFGTLAFGFAVRAIKHNRRLDWALAGAMLGLTHYFFEAGRLFFTPLLVIWVALMVLTLRRNLRWQWQGLVVLALAFLFTAMPAYYTLFAQDKTGTARLEESGLSTEFWQTRLADGLTQKEVAEILHRLSFPFQVYVHQPEIGVFYGGDQALVLEYLVPLFLLGCFYLLWRWRTIGMIAILWILATAGVNALLRDSAVHARWVVVYPAIALVMAVALRYVLPMLIPKTYRVLAAAPIIALVGVIAVAQVAYYYGPHLALLNVQARESKPYRDALDAALRAVEQLPENTEIVIVSSPIADANVPKAFLGFMLKNPFSMTLRTFDPGELTPDFFDSLSPDKNVAFFIEPDDPATLERIQARYQLLPPQASPYNIPVGKEFTLYFAPVGSKLDAS